MRTLMLSRTLNSPRLPMLLLAAGLTAAPWTSSMAAGMEGMDHGSHAMHMDAGDSEDTPSTQAAPTQSRTPIPPITDADRATVYTSHAGHQVHDSAINSYFLADKLEWQDANDGSALAWDLSGWIGGDIDRLLLRSEGERTNGKTEEAEIQALWGHSISPWWDVVAGARQDFKPGAPQTWAAFGLQGQAISDLDIEATAFIGEAGQTAARLEADYDLQLTSNVVLQPTAELNFYGKNDPQRGNGSGLSTSEFGLRLRYEITPQFAPYIGVSWDRSYGKTADYAREDDEDTQDARLVVGVRMWF
ncbi:copper resistance protein CopB [Pseudomonas syringae pv. syringae]|uniref:Copper resistance protein CopB n=2 Tax=Pseudomonas syringae TaxID=317 RepID=A0AAE5VVV5_PSESY|nr:copper resistance protein CopB [Pseudomonas syringae pv. syringae]